jgi:hypothetical protein
MYNFPRRGENPKPIFDTYGNPVRLDDGGEMGETMGKLPGGTHERAQSSRIV